MGSSVVSLAQGLRDNHNWKQFMPSFAPNSKQINSYQLGYLPKPANGSDFVRKFRNDEYHFGDSFFGILKESTATVKEMIELNRVDFCDINWPDTPTKLCFVDLCKTPKLNKYISAHLLPHLIEANAFFVN